MPLFRAILWIPALAALFAGTSSKAGYLYAVDPGAGPGDSRPMSDAALGQYLGATASGTDRLITFEGLSGTGPVIPVGQGVMLESAGLDGSPPVGFQYGLTNIPNSSAVQSNARLGYNVSGDARFTFVPLLNVGTASVLFRSDTPFNSFGLNLTGLGNQLGSLEVWLDGVSPFTVEGSADGGSIFVGYLGDATKRFQTLELRMTGVAGPNRDVFALDDLRLNLVPEPSSMAVLGIGLGASLLASVFRRGRGRRA